MAGAVSQVLKCYASECLTVEWGPLTDQMEVVKHLNENKYCVDDYKNRFVLRNVNRETPFSLFTSVCEMVQ